MDITKISFPKISWIEGEEEIETMKLVCVPSHKYKEVDIAIDLQGSMNIGIIEISREIPYEQAKSFGEELARRWNTLSPRPSPEPSPEPEEDFDEATD